LKELYGSCYEFILMTYFYYFPEKQGSRDF